MSHLCANYCPNYRGERCNTCLVRDDAGQIIVGSFVVSLNPRAAENIFEVESIVPDGAFAKERIAIDFPLHFFIFKQLRLATESEIKLGRRIDSKPIEFDTFKNPMCIEQESNPVDLHQVKPHRVCTICNQKTYQIKEMQFDAVEIQRWFECQIMMRNIALFVFAVVIVGMSVALFGGAS